MNNFKKIHLLSVLATAMFSTSAFADQYIVVAHHQKLNDVRLANIENMGGTVIDAMPEIGVAIVESSAPDFAQKVQKLPNIRFAVKDIALSKDDLFSAGQNALSSPSSALSTEAPQAADLPDDMFFGFQWNLQAIKAPQAWAAGYRGQGTRIAILDTGVDADNFELVENINTDLAKSFIDGENWDVSPEITYHHGTIIATSMVAKDNGMGIVGVAPDAEIVPIKVVSEDGTRGSASALLRGMYYAAQIDADIINMSLGMHINKNTPGAYAVTTAFKRAAKYAWKQGSLIIAAAGNDAIDVSNDDENIHLPGQLPHVITIGATGPVNYGKDQTVDLDQVPSFTNHGEDYIDFAAPGGNDTVYNQGTFETCTINYVSLPCFMFDEMVAIDNNGQVLTIHGTSIATAQASGIAALIIGKTGKNKPRKVLRKMINGDDEPAQDSLTPFFGYGRLNAYESIK
ncbi:MAG: S8 family serine peptidase [Psychrosphaera sp.]|nr:S8 family serine peptidase [Psychrosphaera sp.]